MPIRRAIRIMRDCRSVPLSEVAERRVHCTPSQLLNSRSDSTITPPPQMDTSQGSRGSTICLGIEDIVSAEPAGKLVDAIAFCIGAPLITTDAVGCIPACDSGS